MSTTISQCLGSKISPVLTWAHQFTFLLIINSLTFRIFCVVFVKMLGTKLYSYHAQSISNCASKAPKCKQISKYKKSHPKSPTSGNLFCFFLLFFFFNSLSLSLSLSQIVLIWCILKQSMACDVICIVKVIINVISKIIFW